MNFNFVNLRVRSHHSHCSGLSPVDTLVKRAVELNQSGLGLTDSCSMAGTVELLIACSKYGIKPIIGEEIYIQNEQISSLTATPFPLTILSKNKEGYKNLCRLTTKSYSQGWKNNLPRITKAMLANQCAGIIVASGGITGEIQFLISNNRLKEAYLLAKWYKKLLVNDFYLEIQVSDEPAQKKVNEKLILISAELGIKLIVSAVTNYAYSEDAKSQAAITKLCDLGTNSTGVIIPDRDRKGCHLMSVEEVKDSLSYLPEAVVASALASTASIANLVEEYDLFRPPLTPTFILPPGREPAQEIRRKAYIGLIQKKGLLLPEYQERLELELSAIEKAGFIDYFLIVSDYVLFAKDSGIPTGPGRGSAGGSLVAYALGITALDPVHHQLLFERFLNPGRSETPPDIDTDFCEERRKDVVKYLIGKYGQDRVAQIGTPVGRESKAALKDAARVLNVPPATSQEWANLIPTERGKPKRLEEAIESVPAFRAKYSSDPTLREAVAIAIGLQGSLRTEGIHAAGVVISREPLSDLVPLRFNGDFPISQYDMHGLEKLGLLKFDLLGLKTLTVVRKTLDWIEKLRGIKVDLDKIPENDGITMALISKGQLDGVFQLESEDIGRVTRQLSPTNLKDLALLIALYRPGPLDAGLIPRYINRKHGKESVEYDHPLLAEILGETFGVLVYQEQVIQIAQRLALYTPKDADTLRKAMGKKQPEVMHAEEARFISGCLANGIDQQVAEIVWSEMVTFAGYGFNKSHATAYALVSLQTAYLKAHYPSFFMAALKPIGYRIWR